MSDGMFFAAIFADLLGQVLSPSRIPIPVTLAATSTALVPTCVFGGVFMAFWAMRFGAPKSSYPVRLLHIFGVCAKDHVPRIDASLIATNTVIKLHSRGYRSDQIFVSPPMRADWSARVVGSTSYIELAIIAGRLAAKTSSPRPASIRIVDFNLLPEALVFGIFPWGHTARSSIERLGD